MVGKSSLFVIEEQETVLFLKNPAEINLGHNFCVYQMWKLSMHISAKKFFFLKNLLCILYAKFTPKGST